MGRRSAVILPYFNDIYLQVPMFFTPASMGLPPLYSNQDSGVDLHLGRVPLQILLIPGIYWVPGGFIICMQEIEVTGFTPPSQFAFLWFTTPPPAVGLVSPPMVQDLGRLFYCIIIYSIYIFLSYSTLINEFLTFCSVCPSPDRFSAQNSKMRQRSWEL